MGKNITLSKNSCTVCLSYIRARNHVLSAVTAGDIKNEARGYDLTTRFHIGFPSLLHNRKILPYDFVINLNLCNHFL